MVMMMWKEFAMAEARIHFTGSFYRHNNCYASLLSWKLKKGFKNSERFLLPSAFRTWAIKSLDNLPSFVELSNLYLLSLFIPVLSTIYANSLARLCPTALYQFYIFYFLSMLNTSLIMCLRNSEYFLWLHVSVPYLFPFLLYLLRWSHVQFKIFASDFCRATGLKYQDSSSFLSVERLSSIHYHIARSLLHNTSAFFFFFLKKYSCF